MAYFEEKSEGEWYGIRAERLPALSYIERKKLVKPEKPERSTKRFSLRGLFSSHQEEPTFDTEPTSNTVSGTFYTGVLKCPDCGNTGFVKCGVCSELSCYNDGYFTCAVCGNSGEVSGTISDLNGNMDNNDNAEKTRDNINTPQNSDNRLRSDNRPQYRNRPTNVDRPQYGNRPTNVDRPQYTNRTKPANSPRTDNKPQPGNGLRWK